MAPLATPKHAAIDAKRYPLAPALLVVILLLAGCVQEDAPPTTDAPQGDDLAFAPPVAALACKPSCFEPNVAVDTDGDIFVTGGRNNREIAFSSDGGRTFSILAYPPLPSGTPPDTVTGDDMLQVDDAGRLYFSTLLIDWVPPGTFVAPIIHGMQVAASSDKGRSWEVNTYVSLPQDLEPSATAVDRQWLGFGPDGTVFLSYTHVAFASVGGVAKPMASTGQWIARSDDAGKTFGQFTLLGPDGYAAGPAGPPVVDQEGRIFLPYFFWPPPPNEDGSALRMGISEDGGKTYEVVNVDASDEGQGMWFPIAALDEDGDLFVAWDHVDGGVRVSRSEDGGRTWSKAQRWSAQQEQAGPSPWIAARSRGALDVAWFSVADDQSSADLIFTRGTFSDEHAENATVRAIIAQDVPMPRTDKPGNTDFTHFALTRDGRAVVVWTDTENVYVSTERDGDRV